MAEPSSKPGDPRDTLASGVTQWNGRAGSVTMIGQDITDAGGVLAPVVTSWNAQTGDVTLALQDITGVGGAPIRSPHFLDAPTAPTPLPDSSNSTIPNTAWVREQIAAAGEGGGTGGTGSSPLQAVPPMTGSWLIGCVYNSIEENGVAPGMAWCRMYDNPVYAWMVDPAGSPIYPVILGTLPDWTPPVTDPVQSPRWVVREQHQIYIPDVARGGAHWFFNYMAYNNGAQRQLYADFSDVDLAGAWAVWAGANPTMALSKSPTGGDDIERRLATRAVGKAECRTRNLKERFMKTILLAAVAVIAVAAPARANLLAEYSAGGPFATLCSAASGTACSAGITFTTSNGLVFTDFGATSNSPGTAVDADLLSATVQLNNPTAAAQTITLLVGDTGFAMPVAPPGVQLINSLSGTVTVGGAGNVFNSIACVDQGDGQNNCPGTFSTPVIAANITVPGAGSNSNTTPIASLAAPYSMTEEIVISLDPGANINFTASSDVEPVPEPATLGLLGLGVLGLGLVRARRRSRFGLSAGRRRGRGDPRCCCHVTTSKANGANGSERKKKRAPKKRSAKHTMPRPATAPHSDCMPGRLRISSVIMPKAIRWSFRRTGSRH